MPRYKLIIEYDGRDFVGWQRQDNGLGVQEVLEDAVHALCGARTTVQGAGRTDAGVHARHQVAHVDIDREFPPDTVRDALNSHVRPHAVAVLEAARADDGFHARFSAVERTYLYRIRNRRAPLTYERGLAWWVPSPLDAAAMHEAAQVLVGHHDFTTFRASECQADSADKTLDELTVVDRGDGLVEVRARARSFLHHQVRNMVGTIRLVGDGRWTTKDVETALAARDRKAGGPTAPPFGLYLVGVRYE